MADDDLRRLAHLCGVETSYTGIDGVDRHASDDALRAILSSLGELQDDDAGRAAARKSEESASEIMAPVLVWDEGREEFSFPLGSRCGDQFEITVTLESGEDRSWTRSRADSSVRGDGTIDVEVAIKLPAGYHRLRVTSGGVDREALIICAPTRCYSDVESAWGIFAPLYGLRSEGGRFATYSDLSSCQESMARVGASRLATLPLLCGFFEDEASPYRPLSRRYWNELYLDASLTAEFPTSGEARAISEGVEWAQAERDFGASDTVDYRGLVRHRRQVMEALAASAFGNVKRRGELDEFVRRRPELDDYARFRAAVEARGPWPTWSSQLLDDGDSPLYRYHLYAQWQTMVQLEQCAATGRRVGSGLHLDLPIGVHPDGFDTWKHPHCFAADVSVGAPPDDLFIGGQNWALPPQHPDHSRRAGYPSFRASIRAHLEFAGSLRIDHVMGLHRLYWIPNGFSATEGIYVRQHAHELHAIVRLESHRARCSVFGEDLGTVPPVVRTAMEEYGLGRMYVGQFNFQHDGRLAEVPPTSVASLNTHDTPTFAGFCAGGDLEIQHELSLIDDGELARKKDERRQLVERLLAAVDTSTGDGIAQVMASLTRELARSQASLVLLTLEDCWLELAPQNVPGTGPGHGNWSRRLARSVESALADPVIRSLFDEVDELRRATAGQGD